MHGDAKISDEARPPLGTNSRAIMCLQVLGMQDELAQVKQAAHADTRRMAVEVGALRSDSESLRKELQLADTALEQSSVSQVPPGCPTHAQWAPLPLKALRQTPLGGSRYF